MEATKTPFSETTDAMTLADLVERVQEVAGSDEEVVSILTHLFQTRRARLGTEARPVRIGL